MPEASETINPANGNQGLTDEPSVEVYAVYGAEPEIQAYAMAKYSRSALSMKQSLREISQQKAEKFLNTFYFQYGHRSIADLAHIALAIEKLSILAAIAVADEQRWDGQERSTRYQDFKKSGYFTPDFGDDQLARTLYTSRPSRICSPQYESLSDRMALYLASITPKPDDMKQEAYERTLRAQGVRHFALSVAAGDQYFAGRNCQRADAGNPGLASAFAYPSRSAPSGRTAEARGDFAGV